MNIKKRSQGFTLIELLVVIAIIGILISVVMVSLNAARNKGHDGAVQSNLDAVRAVSEDFYLTQNGSFLPIGTGVLFPIGTCPAYSASGTNMFSLNKNIAQAIAQAVSVGDGTSSCYNSANVWSAAVGLTVTANTSWCVDNQGTAKQEPFAASSAINTSTYYCK